MDKAVVVLLFALLLASKVSAHIPPTLVVVLMTLASIAWFVRTVAPAGGLIGYADDSRRTVGLKVWVLFMAFSSFQLYVSTHQTLVQDFLRSYGWL